MLTIHLHQLQFFAHHGLYEEEKLTGNNFEADVDISLDVDSKIEVLGDTVDYVTVYELIDKRMQQPTALLETIAQDIVELIHDLDNRIKLVSITLKKLSPPIKNFKGLVGVSFKKEF